MPDELHKTARRAGEATAIATPPRPPEGPGALAKFSMSQQVNSSNQVMKPVRRSYG